LARTVVGTNVVQSTNASRPFSIELKVDTCAACA
jgi:hypothetical protein